MHYTDDWQILKCKQVRQCGNYTEDMEVGLHELIDEEDYNQSLLAGCDITADFEDWYGDRNAKILCIMIK